MTINNTLDTAKKLIALAEEEPNVSSFARQTIEAIFDITLSRDFLEVSIGIGDTMGICEASGDIELAKSFFGKDIKDHYDEEIASQRGSNNDRLALILLNAGVAIQNDFGLAKIENKEESAELLFNKSLLMGCPLAGICRLKQIIEGHGKIEDIAPVINKVLQIDSSLKDEIQDLASAITDDIHKTTLDIQDTTTKTPDASIEDSVEKLKHLSGLMDAIQNALPSPENKSSPWFKPQP